MSNSQGGREIVKYSNYHKEETRKSRLINRTVRIDSPGTLNCPKCNKALPGLEHGKDTVCSCGLNMQRFGNGLFLW